MNVTNRKRRGVLALLPILAGVALAVTPFTPAEADSGWCGDGWPSPYVQLVSGDFGLPLWLGAESGALSGLPGHVRLCYATGAPGDSKTFGGSSNVTLIPAAGGSHVEAGSTSDGNAAIGANAGVGSDPTYSLSPGGTGGGQALTFTIPVAFCSGVCHPSTQPADGQTGVIVGTVSQVPPGSSGSGAAYRVDNLCVKVDGREALGDCEGEVLDDTGATTTGTTPVSTVPGTPGPCIVSSCLPSFDSIGTTGRQLGTVYVHGLAPIPVYGVHTCLYQKDAATPCPS